jgi:alkaline phosphatase
MKYNQFKTGLLLCIGMAIIVPSVAQEKPKNIILMIGDGMGLAGIQSAMAVADNTLHLQHIRHIGLMTTHSADNYITDSAAGGTAIATGQKTDNGKISVDPSGKPLKTILELAEAHNYATGLVSTSSILHATPASFIAHHPDRNEYKHIAADFLDTDIDIFIGGGKKDFENSIENRNLIDELIDKDYTIIETMKDLTGTSSNRFAALLADKHLNRVEKGRGDYLTLASEKAVEALSNNNNGFFLMIEGSQIDWGGHANNIDFVNNELIDFDNAVGAMVEFAKQNQETLVIITADHETGALTLFNNEQDKKQLKTEFHSTHHTGIMVPVFAFGPGAEEFMGMYDNTDLFFKMKSLYGFE